jgi:magnesium chelatase subunit I
LSRKILDTGLQFKDLFSSMFDLGTEGEEDLDEEEDDN